MIKLSKLVRLILFLLGTAFFSLLIYVSILGENHKIDDEVTRFFEHLNAGNYDLACQTFPGTAFGPNLDLPEPCSDSGFLLELTLLDHFNLLDSATYTVMIRRNPFWIPFVSEDTVNVDVALTEMKTTLIDKLFQTVESNAYIDNFMTLSRQNGTWFIQSINLTSSSIHTHFTDISSQVDFNRYVQKTDQGYLIQENTVTPSKQSGLDRRLMEYSLNKMNQP